MNFLWLYSGIRTVVGPMLLFVLMVTACTSEESAPQSSEPGVTKSASTEAQRARLRSDSLWQTRVINVPDTLKYGIYSMGWERTPDVHLIKNGTVKVIFESRFSDREGEAAIAARAVWTSEWTRKNEVFLISREPKSFELTGQPPLVEEDDEGMVPLDSDEIPYEDMFLWETADMLREVVEDLDTSYVKVLHKWSEPEKQVLFLLPTSRIQLQQPGPDYDYTYNSDVLRRNFYKPYPTSRSDSASKEKEEGLVP